MRSLAAVLLVFAASLVTVSQVNKAKQTKPAVKQLSNVQTRAATSAKKPPARQGLPGARSNSALPSGAKSNSALKQRTPPPLKTPAATLNRTATASRTPAKTAQRNRTDLARPHNKPGVKAVGPQSVVKRPLTTRPLPPAKSSLAGKGTEAKPRARVTATRSPKNTNTVKKEPEARPDENAEWEKISAISDAMEHVAALRKFLEMFPESQRRSEGLTNVSGIEAAAGNEKLGAGDASGAIELYKAAISDAPVPVPDNVFNDLLAKAPANLFFRGSREGAIVVAKALEQKVSSNAGQLLAIANFYLSVENGTEARRIAEAAMQLDPASAAAAQTLGLAARMDFDLDASAAYYAKALELDPGSLAARRGLAEMKRSMGKPEEAAELYREILAKDDGNVPAQTGLILSLFESGDRAAAENAMAKSLEANPGNVILLAGAAYWYAVHNEGAKAVDNAQKAIQADPRFIWSHIALARGYLAEGKAADAEKTLLLARRYGKFPTLEYELAAARSAAGFYRDAAEGLTKTFATKDDVITTELGGRVPKRSKYFTELVGYERRASIFAPTAADNPDAAARLAALLQLKQLVDSEKPDGDAVGHAADEFVRGDDRMKVHRQLFAASLLLEKKVALPKVLELTRAAVDNVETGLNIPNATSAVLASELYANRAIAAAKGDYVNVPDVARATLLSIMRGRIEEISGWTQYQMDKPDEAVVRLKRAISVLPADSAWWRTTTWQLGAALAAAGKDAEALDWYMKSYKSSGGADPLKYTVIEGVYRKVNGSADGLDAKIGSRPSATATEPLAENVPIKAAQPIPSPSAEAKAGTPAQLVEVANVPIKRDPRPTPDNSSSSIRSSSTPAPTPEVTPEPKPVERSVTTDTATMRIPEGPKTAATPQASPANTPAVTTAVPRTDIEDPQPKATPETLDTKRQADGEKPSATPTAGGETAATRAGTSKEMFPPVIITIPPPQRSRIVADTSQPCKLTVSDESVTLHTGGDDLAVMVGVEGDQRIDDVKATSSSVDDVKVHREVIQGVKTRALFVLTPISDRAGTYQITFEMPCGKKSIQVKVL